MNKDVVATSANIDNITKMLNLLQRIKEDSGKIREISLDDTGWEGMDATAFNNSLNKFTEKLDKTSTDIEEALSSYKTKQQQQLELTDETAKVADSLIEGANKVPNMIGRVMFDILAPTASGILSVQEAQAKKFKNNLNSPESSNNSSPATTSNASKHADPEKKTLH